MSHSDTNAQVPAQMSVRHEHEFSASYIAKQLKICCYKPVLLTGYRINTELRIKHDYRVTFQIHCHLDIITITYNTLAVLVTCMLQRELKGANQ